MNVRTRKTISEKAKEIPEGIKIEIDLSISIAKKISRIMNRQNKTMKDLALFLNKEEEEISNMISGLYNFNLSKIAKIQTFLGEPILKF